MIVFGIHNLDQLNKKAHLGPIGERKEIALDLYDACSRLPDHQRNWMQEAVLRNSASATATFKRTQAKRFEEFDRELEKALLKVEWSAQDPVKIHDIGVSDGRTTIEFYSLLDRVFGVEFHLVASDLDIEFFSVPFGEWGRGIFDSRGTCLQLVLPPFVWNLRGKARSRYTFMNNVIASLINYFYGNRLKERFLSGPSDAFSFATLSKEFRSLCEESANVNVEKYNVLEHYGENEFRIVRAMNVLNRSYFSHAQLLRALKNIRTSLVPGGILITGSNQDIGSSVMGGIYRNVGVRFEIIKEWCGGSPIKQLICS